MNVAKIRQQASNHDVHPDNLNKCVNLFVESAEYAGVGKKEGDDVTFLAAQVDSLSTSVDLTGEKGATDDSEAEENGSKQESPNQLPLKKSTNPLPPTEHAPSGRSVIHVNIDLDSSLDTEKLEKQLELLRRYGAI